MKWEVRVVAAATTDTEPCISVHCESSPAQKYLFNCGENTTRAHIERKEGFRKAKAIFLTGVNVDRSAGLPGLLMSTADSGTPSIQLFGPQGLAHFVASTRLYSLRDSILVTPVECPPILPQEAIATPIFKDNNLTVIPVPIVPSSSSDTHDHTPPPIFRPFWNLASSPLPSHSLAPQNSSSLTGLAAEKWRYRVARSVFSGMQPTLAAPRGQNISTKKLPTMHTVPSAISYIGIGPSIRGKFDPVKAKALGVKPGPDFGKLTKGENVLSKTGSVVSPETCMEPPLPPVAFIFIDCPDPSYIPSLIASPQFNIERHFGNVILNLMIHRLGNGVVEDPRYRAWMNSFPSTVHHLIANERYSTNPVVFGSSAYTQLRLSQIDPSIFHIPSYSNHASASLSSLLNLPPNTTLLNPSQQIQMHPPSPPQPIPYPPLDKFESALSNLPHTSLCDDALVESIEKARIEVEMEMDDEERTEKKPGDDVVITALGTGSAMPSKFRNVSATLVQIPKWGNVLLDAGEGTWGQLARHFGASEVNDVIRDLKCVFISHIHGDHHIGLSKILVKRRMMKPDQPLYLIANRATQLYLREYQDLQDLGIDDEGPAGVRVITCEDIEWREQEGAEERDRLRSFTRTKELCSVLGMDSVATVDVVHRTRCFGIVMRHSEGWSLVFSGDTKPCPNLAQAGEGATVLIHEATMADDEVLLAEEKAHSTFSQAVDIGRQMKAKHILLTHFSQRYPKMPQSQASSGVDPAAPDPIIALAFDHLSIPIGSLWKMSKYTEAIQRCFLDGEEDHDAVDQDEESSNAGGKRRSAEIGGVKPVLKRMKMA